MHRLSGRLINQHRRWITVFSLFAIAAASLQAHDVITTKLTYTREISRILAARCVSCHGTNSSIPLTTYEETRPWAVSIKEQVLSRAMPPWGAVKGFGHFSPDNALSQEELIIISAWVIGGAPKGDPALLPNAKKTAPIQPPVLANALTVDTKARLVSPLVLAALAPQPDSAVPDVKITATLPDGEIQPIVWLHGYQPAWHSTFRLASGLHLPAGTVIEASAPLRFTLQTSVSQAPMKAAHL